MAKFIPFIIKTDGSQNIGERVQRITLYIHQYSVKMRLQADMMSQKRKILL